MSSSKVSEVGVADAVATGNREQNEKRRVLMGVDRAVERIDSLRAKAEKNKLDFESHELASNVTYSIDQDVVSLVDCQGKPIVSQMNRGRRSRLQTIQHPCRHDDHKGAQMGCFFCGDVIADRLSKKASSLFACLQTWPSDGGMATGTC
jgi:hypothetical protein